MIASNLAAFRPPSIVVGPPPLTHSTWSLTALPSAALRPLSTYTP